MLRILCLCAALAVSLTAAKPFDVSGLLRMKRLSDPQLSPDGKTVLFVVQTVDVEGNKKTSQIYGVPLTGGSPVALTTAGSNDRPRWAPDSKRVAFISDRGGSSQIWMMNPDGTEQRQVTKIATEASGVTFFPDGTRLLFVSEVFPGCKNEICNEQKLAEEKAAKTKARSYTSLLYRHWNQWSSRRRSHLLVVQVEGGESRDLTPGPYEVPTFSLGGPDGYAISPDSKEICYVANTDADQALSTNSNLYTVSPDGGEATRITTTPGADVSPAYSPDGQWIAWRAQKTAGYESDRWRLFLMKRSEGKVRDLTENINLNVQSLTWTPDSTRLFFTIEDRGRQSIQMFVLNATGGARSIVSGNATYDDMQFTPDAKTMIFTQQSGSRPTEIFRVNSGDGKIAPLTRMNDEIVAEYNLPNFEEITVTGAEGAKVSSFVVKPAGFSPDRKYPVLFLIHGGPQGAWNEAWSYRWNPQVFAAAGFVVVMPNPRGSTGYGQKFTDDINNDWGGKVYDDVMATVDHIAGQPWADAERFAAAGGSYGGYLVNWMLGHTQKFKALVSHAGVFDLRSMAGETEELWFVNWEFRGMPWDNPDAYAKWSPSYFVNEFRTPTLVIHGDLDYRVPLGQGLQLFTALQMKKVPSKLLTFPDEGHWIGKPQNTILWYQTFLEWITEWTKKPPTVVP
ncbi:MAG: S9 family peptidase [Acidobacteriaceae bacterium]|nr:S9 family peptidase [Acidobacteriaceae bacterium]